MRLSTVAELAGFGCLVAAGWVFGLVPGLLVSAAVLLMLGYLIEDDVAEVPIRRRVAAMRSARLRRKSAKAAHEPRRTAPSV